MPNHIQILNQKNNNFLPNSYIFIKKDKSAEPDKHVKSAPARIRLKFMSNVYPEVVKCYKEF